MSRRRSSKQDSLELLLDTICNTFGGVLFIAILVVLLLQQTGKAPASATEQAAIPLSPLELQSLTFRWETVEAELDRLRQNRRSQEAVVQSFVPDEIQQLLTTRSEVTTRQERLQSEVDRLLTSNTGLAVKIENVDIENDVVRKQLDQTRTRLAMVQAKLDDDRKSRISEVRMPVLRESWLKREIGLVLRYGRLYVWHQYASDGRRMGLNTDDFVVVAEQSDGLVVHPNPAAGLPLDDSQASKEAVLRVLRRFDPKDVYLVSVTRPDSYGVFHLLRDRAIELGFEYRLIPVDTNDPIADRGGTGGHVQ